jgi:hypothetical protein
MEHEESKDDRCIREPFLVKGALKPCRQYDENIAGTR